MKQQRGVDRSATKAPAFAAKETDDELKPPRALTGDLVRRGRARASTISAVPSEPPLRPIEDRAPPTAEEDPPVDFVRDPRWWVTWCAVFFITFVVGLNLLL